MIHRWKNRFPDMFMTVLFLECFLPLPPPPAVFRPQSRCARTSFTLINRNGSELTGHSRCYATVRVLSFMEHNLSHVPAGICFEIRTQSNDNNAFCRLSPFVYSNQVPACIACHYCAYTLIKRYGCLDGQYKHSVEHARISYTEIRRQVWNNI